MKRYVILFAVMALAVGVLAVPSGAQEAAVPDRLDRPLPDSIQNLKLESPLSMGSLDLARIDPVLSDAEGSQLVSVRLSDESVAEVAARGAGAHAQKAQGKKVKAQQDKFLDRAMHIDANFKKIGSTHKTLNAVFIEVDASALESLAADPNVVWIHKVVDYEMDLSETVPYIGATDVQNSGFDGSGVRVGVIDSGIDYYHAALGGSGNPADYAVDDPTIIEPGTFPTDKVVGGYDFVGAVWPGGPLLPDSDPLDDGPGAGHGTHVAHIIGGLGGVAPGVDLYALKVCSSVSTSCSGVALINAMDFAVDPDGDDDVSDHLDIVNQSLGSLYGTAFDDDLSQAVNAASAIGVLTVAAAGNGSDKPYILDTPSAAASAISVAQTAVPSAVLPLMEVTAPEGIKGLYPAVFQSWSARLTTPIEGPLQYGDGAGGNLDGCASFASGSLTGKIVLVDRGSCNFTLKISNIGQAGGLAGIIGLVAPGDPFNGGDGGDRPIDIPGFMVSQAISTTLKSGLPNTAVRFDPATGIPLVGSMVGSSSRGPSMRDNLLKPEIGAPGASVSAIAGTGFGEGPFGGTSGATPMVTGSAALLLNAYPSRSPAELKAILMNTAETSIINDALLGDLAPISRIGGGEVRVDAAVSAPAAAWDDDLPSGGLSFGYVDAWQDTMTLHKTVRVRNYSDEDVEYSITPTFRFADDEASGAVSIQAPKKVKVKAGKDATFPVKMTINSALLPGNYMNSGSMGANPAALTVNEYDGYLMLDDGEQPIHLAWHVLPRKSARVAARPVLTFNSGLDVVSLTNTGVGTAQNDAYAMVAVSPNIPEGGPGEGSPTPDIKAVGINTFPVPAGFCSANPSFIWAFAVSTWEPQSHLVPVSFLIDLDIDGDGVADATVLNRDSAAGPPGFNQIGDGRQVTWALDYNAGTASAYFFTEHATNTGNTALYICAEQVGLTGEDMLATSVDMSVTAQDFYFGGPGDFIGDLTVTPLGERYLGLPDDVPGKSEGSMTVIDYGPWPGNTPEYGVLMFTNGDRGSGARGGATMDTESMLFFAK